MAASAAVKEALWLRKLAPILGMDVQSVPLACDNQGTIKLLKNPISSPHSKHIDVQHLFARERVCRGEVSLTYVSTKEMLADILTKPLPLAAFTACRDGMGIA